MKNQLLSVRKYIKYICLLSKCDCLFVDYDWKFGTWECNWKDDPIFSLGNPRIRLWRVGLFDFGLGSGRVWLKSSGFGFGFGYCAYYGLKANSLVILCNSISCKGAELMLRKNWNIITTYSSLHQQPCLPSKRTVWFRRKRHPKFRDTLDIDGAIAKCLLCK